MHFLEKWPRQHTDKRLILKTPAALHVRPGERDNAIIAAPLLETVSGKTLAAQTLCRGFPGHRLDAVSPKFERRSMERIPPGAAAAVKAVAAVVELSIAAACD